ncbi:hypothetical protein B0H15DRAFT_957195 [Mycena belliarum]|uniref:Uncharacterized protein n=1 Tax=Mycena belliarum TaxID=1033014 RepID=A0AAD6TMZ7_9AGAR|nr:hypothetical protein B0H15DRAFT_957195 [Mycena belliae]
MLARLQVVTWPTNEPTFAPLAQQQVLLARSTPPLPPSDRAAPAPLDYATYSYSNEAVLVHRRKRRVLSYGAPLALARDTPHSRPLLLGRAVKLTLHVRSGTTASKRPHNDALIPHVVPSVRSTQVPVTSPLDRSTLHARPKESPVRNPLGCVPGTRNVRAALYVHRRRRTVPLGPLRRVRAHSNARAVPALPIARRPPQLNGSRADSCRRVLPPAGAPCTAPAAFPFPTALARTRPAARSTPAFHIAPPARSRLPLPPIPRPSTPIPSRRPNAPRVASMRLAPCAPDPGPPARRPASKVSAPLGYTARDSRTSNLRASDLRARAAIPSLLLSPNSGSLPDPDPSQIPIPSADAPSPCSPAFASESTRRESTRIDGATRNDANRRRDAK